MPDATRQPDTHPDPSGSSATEVIDSNANQPIPDNHEGGSNVLEDPSSTNAASVRVIVATPERTPLAANEADAMTPILDPGVRAAAVDAAAIDEVLRGHPALPPMPSSRGFLSTLLGTLVYFISLAAAVTVALYVVELPSAATDLENRKHFVAPLVGILVGDASAIIFALVNRDHTQPDRVDPRVCGEFR